MTFRPSCQEQVIVNKGAYDGLSEEVKTAGVQESG